MKTSVVDYAKTIIFSALVQFFHQTRYKKLTLFEELFFVVFMNIVETLTQQPAILVIICFLENPSVAVKLISNFLVAQKTQENLFEFELYGI